MCTEYVTLCPGCGKVRVEDDGLVTWHQPAQIDDRDKRKQHAERCPACVGQPSPPKMSTPGSPLSVSEYRVVKQESSPIRGAASTTPQLVPTQPILRQTTPTLDPGWLARGRMPLPMPRERSTAGQGAATHPTTANADIYMPHPYADDLSLLGWCEPMLWQTWRADPPLDAKVRQERTSAVAIGDRLHWPLPLPYERRLDFYQRRLGSAPLEQAVYAAAKAQFDWRREFDATLDYDGCIAADDADDQRMQAADEQVTYEVSYGSDGRAWVSLIYNGGTIRAINVG